MTLRGDLATLELADIVQNLEMHQKSGALAVETPRGTSQVYVESGSVAMIATPGRPRLMEDLVRAGLLRPADVESARKRRWRTRKSLGEMLVKRKVIGYETLRDFALCRLQEDFSDFLALSAGAFTFTEGRPPRDVFDAEERVLALALPMGPALFEAARRMDHMPAIRGHVPSDTAHYHAQASAQFSGEGDPELVRALLTRLDGTRSVKQVMQAFPHRRFEAYETLARLAEAQVIRTYGPDDMASLARHLADGNADLAWQVVQDGLASNAHHLGLLREKAALAGERGESKAAAEALKVIAHVQLEAGDRGAALVELMRAGELDPEDTSILERTLELAIEDERVEDAFEHGMRLVELYRLPGLHSKAVVALESMVRLDPDRFAIQRELARSRADCGNTTAAVAGLERYGKKLLAREEYRPARLVQQEILKLVPSRKQAQKTIEMIDSQVFERRRALRRRIVQRVVLVLVAAAAVTFLVFDVRARLDYARADHAVSRGNLIELREYGEAIRVFEAVRDAHPYTLTAHLDLRRRLADLEQKRAAQAERRAEASTASSR